jgi:acyl-CoA thioesterase
MDDLKQFFANDRYAELSGIELLSIAPGRATARMAVHPHHLNGLGTVQGGATFTLADLAFAAAANSHGTVAVSVNVSISYFKAVSSGVLVAEARELSVNAKLGSYTVDVRDGDGQLVAVFQGLAYRKSQSLPLAPGTPLVTGG